MEIRKMLIKIQHKWESEVLCAMPTGTERKVSAKTRVRNAEFNSTIGRLFIALSD
jgi:hypothetical protein